MRDLVGLCRVLRESAITVPPRYPPVHPRASSTYRPVSHRLASPVAARSPLSLRASWRRSPSASSGRRRRMTRVATHMSPIIVALARESRVSQISTNWRRVAVTATQQPGCSSSPTNEPSSKRESLALCNCCVY